MPIGVLDAPQSDTDAIDGRISQIIYFSTQRLAVCEHSRLVAVANGRIIDLFLLDAVTPSPSPHDHEATTAHLPFVGQLALDDYASDDEADDDHVVSFSATCVCFVSASVLLVAFDRIDIRASSSTETTTTTTMYLAAFRLFPRRIVVATSSSSSSSLDASNAASLVTHCCFRDRVDAATPSITAMHVISSSSQDAGAVVLRFATARSFALLLWRERLADRELVVVRLPSTATSKPSDAVVTAADVSTDGRWLVLGDEEGGVWLVDCGALAWDLRAGSASAVDGERRSPVGRRLELVAINGIGGGQQRMRSRSGIEHARLAHVSRLRRGISSLRWLQHATNERHLVAGNVDGALSVRLFVGLENVFDAD
ncbi:hypothetical protein PINS_up011395 [Pythium insidiosum]|nr:hypothetical protein PINS_up011395 [Pythium insidiosum]